MSAKIYIIWQMQYSKKITGCSTAFSSIASQHALVAVLTHSPLHSGRSVTTVEPADRTQTNNGSLAAVLHILSSYFRVCPVEVLLERQHFWVGIHSFQSKYVPVNLLRTTWTSQQTAVSVTLSSSQRGEKRFVHHAKLVKASSGVIQLNGNENGDYKVDQTH